MSFWVRVPESARQGPSAEPVSAQAAELGVVIEPRSDCIFIKGFRAYARGTYPDP